MRSVASALKVYHTIDASEGCASALVAMRVKLFLGEDITTGLGDQKG